MPQHLQVKLLHFLQNKSISRIGGFNPISVDVRIIAATNKDLSSMIKEGSFREDLFYRLMVIPMLIPPLRYRKDDIVPLTYHFVSEFSNHFGFKKKITAEAIDRLISYDWPGNVRELRNVIERILVMLLQPGGTGQDLPDFISSKKHLPKVGSKLKDAVIETEIFLLSETFKKYKSWKRLRKSWS